MMIGYKVKIVDTEYDSLRGRVGTVVEVKQFGSGVHCRVYVDEANAIWCKPDTLRRVMRVRGWW